MVEPPTESKHEPAPDLKVESAVKFKFKSTNELKL